MSQATAVAAVLWTGATMYAVFGGADFGGGLWSLLAGGGERGRRGLPRSSPSTARRRAAPGGASACRRRSRAGAILAHSNA